MRIPPSVRETLRAVNTANMPDTCVVMEPGADVVLPGGVVRPGPAVQRINSPCRIVPVTAANDIIATRESRANLYIVMLPVGVQILHDDTLQVTSAEFGWTKSLQVDTVLDGYTDEVVVKVYAREG